MRRPPRPARPPALRVLALAAVLAVAGCGGGGGDDPASARGGDVFLAAAEGLDDEQLAGQSVIVGFRQHGATIPSALRDEIAAGRVGGVILFGENGRTVAPVRALARRLQAIERPGRLGAVRLLVMSDQEGGLVRRIEDAPPARSAAQQARAGATTVRAAGRGSARALCRAGVNVNLAPVADRADGFIAEQGRAYAADAARTGALAAAFARGARDGGIAATAKHFPGLGGATTNTDEGRSVVDRPLAALRAEDEAAFVPLIRDGVPLVMLANAIYPALDRAPAVLSRRVVEGELRGRLGFRGVTISDDLQAGAFRATTDRASLAVAAASAGVDLLLYGQDADEGSTAVDALAAALAAGRLDRARQQRAVARILRLRTGLTRGACGTAAG